MPRIDTSIHYKLGVQIIKKSAKDIGQTQTYKTYEYFVCATEYLLFLAHASYAQ